MPYSDDLQAIFLHIPKTGGTAIKRLFDIYGHNTEDPDVIPSPQHLTCSLLRVFLGTEKYDRYYKFTCVRNPWSRLLSDYFWRQRQPKGTIDMEFRQYAAYAAEHVRSGRYYQQPFADHFIPQVEYTRNVDFVFRFEQFADGINTVASRLGLDPGEIPPKPVREYDSYWNFYDSESREIVADIYQDDIEQFGYEFENG